MSQLTQPPSNAQNLCILTKVWDLEVTKILIFSQISGLVKHGYMWVMHETYIYSFEKVIRKSNARLNVKLVFPRAKIMVLRDGLEEWTSKRLK